MGVAVRMAVMETLACLAEPGAAHKDWRMSNSIVLKNVRIIDPSRNLDEIGTIIVKDGVIVAAGQGRAEPGRAGRRRRSATAAASSQRPAWSMPASIVGEPGGEHRETIASASRAAAAGGVTSIIMMPDTDPVIDDIALVEFVKKTATRQGARQCLSGSGAHQASRRRGDDRDRPAAEAGAVCLHQWPPSACTTRRCCAAP